MASSSTDDAKVRNFAGPLIVSNSARFGIVASRFNGFIVERLVDGAIDTLIRHGASPENIVVARVPGAWEIPPVLRRLAASRKFDALLTLGAVIRGATPHFEYVAAEASKGVAKIQLETGTPISFGVLTTDTVEQAIERAGSKAGNKGVDAALAVIETLGLLRELEQAGY